jgi:4-hydroxythreonine-4-phosphate dehydrogenase
MKQLPRILLTMGDAAGIGPEIIAKAWPDLFAFGKPIVVGDAETMRRAVELVRGVVQVTPIRPADQVDPTPEQMPCVQGTDVDLYEIRLGVVCAATGQAAYDCVCKAIDLTLAGQADAIVTAPLHKESLHAGGLPFPGHTEILAARTNTKKYAMMLHTQGLSVVHVTLHMALRDVFRHLTPESVNEKIRLLHDWLGHLTDSQLRIGVAALNPHAGDGGLFGDEEEKIIRPAIAGAREDGIDVTGPWPCDTLFVRARNREFDGVVVMYHDQGHIAMKLLGIEHLVNITVGLPIIRTSVAHGTAYDIAGKGIADAGSLIEATWVASQLAIRAAATKKHGSSVKTN